MGHKVKQSLVNSRVDFFYYAFRNVLLVGVPLVIISALILGLTTSHSSADTASSDDITLKLDVACTVSSVVTSPHSALDMNVGQYKTDIGNTDISVFCNDNNGYSVYAIGNSNSTDGNSDLISNINENYNIHTGTNTTGNSSWAMKLTAGTGTSSETTPPSIVNGYNNYSLIPNNYTLVATRPSGTSMNPDTSASGSYFSTTYAIYAASTQPAGTYNGKVKYVMVHPDNSTHNTIPDIEAAFAAAGKQKAYQDTGGNYYYAMQDMDSTICASVDRKGVVTATQLVDNRDNNLYWVAKLDDDNCWMTQNLDFDIDTTRTYTHNDTDLGWDPNSFDSNATWKPDTTNGRYNLPVNGTSVPGWSNQNNYPYSADPGDIYYYTSNSGDNDIKYTTLSACVAAGHTDGECKHYHAGNYYNWTAAIASNNSSSLTTQYANAPNSICPKGWRLPIATNANQSIYEFGELLYEQGIITTKTSTSYAENGFNNIRKTPLQFIRSGNIAGTILYNPMSQGGYWSSTVYDNDHAYYMFFNSGIVSPVNYSARNYKSDGWSIRCLAR